MAPIIESRRDIEERLRAEFDYLDLDDWELMLELIEDVAAEVWLRFGKRSGRALPAAAAKVVRLYEELA